MSTPREEPERFLGAERERENDYVVAEKLRAMHEDDLLDFIRDTIVRLDTLADRLEVFTDREAGNA